MADYTLSQTGSQINTALNSVITANNSGGIVNQNILDNYPSYLFPRIFPIGSIYIMSTNTNPGTFLGGTWELFDKEFKTQTINKFSPTLNTTNCTSAEVYGHLVGHNIHLNIKFTNKVAITDSTLEMFTIPPGTFGIDTFYIHYITHFTDANNAVLISELNGNGVFSTYDVIVRGSSTASLAASTNISNIMLDMDSIYTHMLDSFCDKFYFKRTA